MDIITFHEQKSTYDYLLKKIPNPNFLITNKTHIRYQKRLRRPSSVCLSKSKFLLFNTKAIKFIIIDKDNISMNDFIAEYADKLMLLKYSWLIETDNGIQLCYTLKDAIPTFKASLKTKSYLNAIKDKLITIFNADKRGSKRSYGIWRNPYTHKGWIDIEAEYTLKEIAESIELEAKYINSKYNSNNAINNILVYNSKVLSFLDGNRNNALYWHCVYQINSKSSVSLIEFEKWGVLVNRQQANPLEDLEAEKTARSAFNQYHLRGKRLKFIPEFNYIKWKKGYNKKYYDNNKKEDIMTKQEAVKLATLARSIKAKTKIEQVLTSMSLFNEKITISSVSKMAKVDFRTAKKYMVELGYIKEKKNPKTPLSE